jgi:hypothetical protein
MTCGFARTLAAAVLSVAVGGVALAVDAPAPGDTKALDKTVVDALRDVHNYGADLYNLSKDYAAAYRVYDGALRAVKPLLGHRPAVQKTIDDGLASAGKEGDPARRAFLLHETIEKVRADLRGTSVTPKKPTAEDKKPEEPKKSVTEPKKPVTEPKMPEEKKPEPKKVVEPKKPADTKPKEQGEPAPLPKLKGPEVKGDGALVSGVISYQGKALAAGEVTFISLDQKAPKVLTATVKDGKYAAKGLPPGKYKVVVDGGKDAKLPAKYSTADTSGLTVEAKAGANTFDFDLK